MSKQFKKSKEKTIPAQTPPKENKPVSPKSQSSEPKAIWIFVLLFMISLVLYGNTMQNGYSMDDELVTLKQPNVESGIAGIPKILAARYSVNNKQHYEYRPIALVTFAIEYQFFGRDPVANHFFNIVFYALSSLLVYLAIKKIFVAAHWILPLLTALIFTIHPMHSEVAASLKNRDEMLALIFALLSLIAFINFADKLKWKYIVYGLIYLLLALFSKKSAMPFAAIIPLVIILTRQVKPLKIIGFTAALAVTTSLLGKLFLGTVLEKSDTLREMFFFENPLYSGLYDFGEKLMMALASFGYYVKMMFVPYPLVSYYGYNTFDGFHFNEFHAIGLAAGLGILFLLYKYFKTKKEIVVGLVFFCIGISMFINLVAPAVGIIAERFAFEASMGFCLLLASAILMFTKSDTLKPLTRFAQIAPGIKITFVVLTLISAVVIIPRNKAWYSKSSLYHTDILAVPECTKLNSLLGTEHTNLLNSHIHGDTALKQEAITAHADSAISYFRRALKIYPDYITVNNNLGTVYYTFNTILDSAGYFFNRACELDTDYVEAYFNLGNYYDQIAEIAAQKLTWINSILPDQDSSVADSKNNERAQLLKTYDPIFLKVLSLKSQLNSVFTKFAMGKGTGDPKASVLDALLFYFRDLTVLRAVGMDHMGLADGLILVFKHAAKTKDPYVLNYSIDSIVNKYYFETITKGILNDTVTKGITKENRLRPEDLNNNLRACIRGDLRKYRALCIKNLEKSMRLNKDYMTAYTKLTQVLPKWGMYEELIKVHKQVLNNPNYKDYSINFSLAEAYFAIGDYKQTALYMITGLKQLQKVNTRMNLVFNNFNQAQNSFVLGVLKDAKENNKSHVMYYINKFMYEISNRQPYEAVQIQQLYNMIKTL